MTHNPERPRTVPTPEVLAGRELYRLRKQRKWSQADVADRMAAYGYDSWHQSTVGRTEAAQRPLRLNEAVALADLFGVPAISLLVPLQMGVADVDEEIRLTEEAREKTMRDLEVAHSELLAEASAYNRAFEKHKTAGRAVDWADSHLEAMRALRDIMRDQDVTGMPSTLADFTVRARP